VIFTVIGQELGEKFLGRVFAVDAQRHDPSRVVKVDGGEREFNGFFHFYVNFSLVSRRLVIAATFQPLSTIVISSCVRP
jgi:hypothetical protein